MFKLFFSKKALLFALILMPSLQGKAQKEQTGSIRNSTGHTWTADNGNGTFTNPLFYEDFCDPDIIRVGDDFYMTGTTMHAMPGLPVLHSKDLVNWKLASYAFDKLDLGPEFRLEDEKGIYSQGIWAPCIRHHKGKFYILADVNRQKTQLFISESPAGPWEHTEMNGSFHDPSVLFDDDGKIYMVWGARALRMAQLAENMKDTIPGTGRVLFDTKQRMDEGAHFYKINGKYYITSIWWKTNPLRMVCARADKPEGPYEVNPAITAGETFGLAKGHRLRNPRQSPPFKVIQPHTNDDGNVSIAQGGLIETSTGEWWGFAHNDYNSIGRPTSLAPITWKDGWPYFGLAGNLKRAPRTWVKPNTKYKEKQPFSPYQRDDDFDGSKLSNIWQWNHVPVDSKWSLSERPGYLRLNSLPAKSFWLARNTLTQRGVGPVSQPTVELDANGMKTGDVAGLALLTAPYSWVGLVCGKNGLSLEQYYELTDDTVRISFTGKKVWLRAHCDYLTEKAQFSYSTDGKSFSPLGKEITMFFQVKTFQGVRYALFNYNSTGCDGGYADFDNFTVYQPHPHGLMRPIPYKKTITLTNRADKKLLSINNTTKFKVIDRKLGRAALQLPQGFISVNPEDGKISVKRGRPEQNETFQWIETPYGDLVLLSLATNRYLHISTNGEITANCVGPKPDRRDGTCLTWQITK